MGSKEWDMNWCPYGVLALTVGGLARGAVALASRAVLHWGEKGRRESARCAKRIVRFPRELGTCHCLWDVREY